MKLTHAQLNTPRRIFLAVVVGLALVLAWTLSEPWRTDVRTHRVGGYLSFWRPPGDMEPIWLGTNQLSWVGCGNDCGNLLMGYPGLPWEFAPCQRKDLHSVMPEDARCEFFGAGTNGSAKFGRDWHVHTLIINDGQILLARLSTATQTVYAIEAVEQEARAGKFRSRQILPAPRNP